MEVDESSTSSSKHKQQHVNITPTKRNQSKVHGNETPITKTTSTAPSTFIDSSQVKRAKTTTNPSTFPPPTSTANPSPSPASGPPFSPTKQSPVGGTTTSSSSSSSSSGRKLTRQNSSSGVNSSASKRRDGRDGFAGRQAEEDTNRISFEQLLLAFVQWADLHPKLLSIYEEEVEEEEEMGIYVSEEEKETEVEDEHEKTEELSPDLEDGIASQQSQGERGREEEPEEEEVFIEENILDPSFMSSLCASVVIANDMNQIVCVRPARRSSNVHACHKACVQYSMRAKGSKVFLTKYPCVDCVRTLIQVGVKNVFVYSRKEYDVDTKVREIPL
jgi:hypothetical protein